MRGEKNVPNIEIGSQGEKASDFAVSPAAASSGFTYPSLPLPPSIVRSLCFAKTYVFSSLNLYTFSLYPQLSLWLIAGIEVSLSNRGAQNCAECVILEESLLQHLERENCLPENCQDVSVYAIHKHNYTFSVTS